MAAMRAGSLVRGGYLALAALLLFASPASAEVVEGRVVRVIDGDTLTVLVDGHQQVKLRLAGLDAPERGQPFGERSRRNLARLVAGKDVEVHWHKHDRYGRVVGQVWVVSPDMPCRDDPECPKTLDAGLAPLTVGLAWHYKKYAHEQSEQDRERHAFAEVGAGLWRDPAPVAPWE
jgi:endonuclease YncB( thermonuclease family)